MPDIKVGPLSAAEIQSVWESSVDKGYRDPLVEAGEGSGFEAWTQLFSQLERASKAIDVTTQAMFIAPWSGQSNPPASGARKSTVFLSISRSGRLERALVLGRGTLVEEQTLDWGEEGSQEVFTGRRYALLSDLVFHPGEAGPFSVEAEAEKPGYGYDNPLPGTIKNVPQVGAVFENDHAEVAVVAAAFGPEATSSSAKVVAAPQADMFVSEHVGQYVLFTAGANAGRQGRAVEFGPPLPEEEPPLGSTLFLELFASAKLDSVSGVFLDGESLAFDTPATGRAKGTFSPATGRLGFVLVNGTSPAVGAIVTGLTSGATGTISSVLDFTEFAAEAPVAGVGGAAWRILGWVEDWGLVATNPASPAGGRSAMLDELGNERKVNRSPGERDDIYRDRVREIADVVSPNAIKRQLNKTLEGFPWCLREAGQEGLPGFFFDGTGEPPAVTPHGFANDAYDVDCFVIVGTVAGTFEFQEPVVLEFAADSSIVAKGWFGKLTGGTMIFVRREGKLPSPLTGWRVRGERSGATLTTLTSAIVPSSVAERRYHVWLDYEQFRAFFLVTMNRSFEGEFGFGYDVLSKSWAWDVPSPWTTAFDGFPYLAQRMYRRAYEAVDPKRAGGVGFEIGLDDGSCP